MVIFKSKQKKLEGDLKIKLCGKRLHLTESVKYIFHSYLSYCCLEWAHNFSTIRQTLILQEMVVRIFNFQLRKSHTRLLFKQNSTLKLQGKTCLINNFFVRKPLNNFRLSIFNT